MPPIKFLNVFHTLPNIDILISPFHMKQCESELIKFIILQRLRNGGIHFSRLYGTDQVRHISPVLGKIVIDILCGRL